MIFCCEFVSGSAEPAFVLRPTEDVDVVRTRSEAWFWVSIEFVIQIKTAKFNPATYLNSSNTLLLIVNF